MFTFRKPSDKPQTQWRSPGQPPTVAKEPVKDKKLRPKSYEEIRELVRSEMKEKK